MIWARATTFLTWLIAVAFILLGIIEVAVRLLGEEPLEWGALLWWAGSLIGGGTLILVGRFGMAGRPATGTLVLVIGCILGSIATTWTVVLPAIAIIVVALGVFTTPVTSGTGTA